MRAARAPVTCTLVEEQGRLGGKIRTEKVDDFIIEAG
ncbi:MAG: FAD-dependent oxidoreductase, partial [Nitrososphaerales archaeon]